jgi:hypothetical protein
MLRRAAIFALGLLPPMLFAQTHKVAAPEKVTRAIAVYEWTGEIEKPNAARLVPVSLFIDSHFEDAGVYLAQPTPFVLQSGIVYSIERAGESIGTLDLDYARNIVTRRSATDDAPLAAWFGYGRFLTPAAEAAQTKKLRPAAKPSVIVASGESDSEDDKPKFIRRESTDSTASPSTSTGGSAKKPAATASTGTEPDADDPDRPTLRHRDPVTDAAKSKKSRPAGYVSGPSTSLNDDPDRPLIRRGIPTGATVPSPLAGLPPELHQAVAVSDATYHDPHPFSREWDSLTERAQTLAAIETLVKPRVASYLVTNKLSAIAVATSAAKPQPAHVATHATHPLAKKSAVPAFVLNGEHLSGYSLTYGGLPTFIYTAEVPVVTGGPVYVTMVTQRLPSGELQVSLSSVTDASHLDRTPWMRPIDVVDADWSHRASLLFELRGQVSRQFALYRLITAQAEQTFITGPID